MRGWEERKRSKSLATVLWSTWCANHVMIQLIAKYGGSWAATRCAARRGSAAATIGKRSWRDSVTASSEARVESRRCVRTSTERSWKASGSPTWSISVAAISCRPCTLTIS
jgi:hypothetical protein